ncbi:NADPH:quinone oxidoreductase family protein [Actinomadura rudentiformis]|uniref:NADPH:quinone oxidoreductase family protein n=1 Tax=Actinomadura rudentiformis TaxID=359158 RepID=A0A6H9Z663_9ACTN|nr:NADPH:quinone oxidoreductase family protein [Actinomadura rudentiformis]KAB2350270.1 NADPH:quinone oxidoreductase family protein [Actinomadura rudentiformis]
MRVLAARQPGGPDQLQLRELPDPTLSAGQVRVTVNAVGLNFAELVQLSGDFQIPVPDLVVPGFELAGIVAEVAPDVTTLAVGQRVIALVSWGAYTDQLVVNAAHVLPIPDGMDDLTAAAFPVSYATAHVSLLHRGQLQRGETVVVTGATGNVGEAALQVARAVGAQVIAVDRAGTLPPTAADHVLPPKNLAQGIRDLTGGRGADLALDLVGGDLTAELLDGLAWEGRLVTTGFASGTIPTISLLDVLVRNITITGEDIAGYASRDIATAMRALRQCLDWYADGLLVPRTPIAQPFTQAAAALSSIADGTARHKLALDLTGSFVSLQAGS